jgi:predicted enzyme related to lactoylglutathione lyase
LNVDIVFAGVAVTNFPDAISWYDGLFGRPADVVVTDDEVMWRFSDTAWLYVVHNPERAGQALVALSVADLDQTVKAIAGRGITGQPIEKVGDAGRKATFSDSDGNEVSFIQVTTPAG